MHRVLSISLDKQLLEEHSASAYRLSYYAEVVEGIHALVPSQNSRLVTLSTKTSVEGSGGRGKVLQAFLILRKAVSYAQSGQFDLISVQDTGFIAGLALLAARWSGLPLEVQVHGFERRGFVANAFAKMVLRSASGVRAVSRRLERTLVAFGVDGGKITVAPIYARPEPLGERIELVDGRIILSVGRLVPIKNHRGLIEAFANLSIRHTKARLWIVGDGPLRGELSLLVEKLGISEKVEFFGQQVDVSKFYRSASIFAFPSLSEGWGMVVIEAAGYGLPIVMSDTGCAGEFLVDNKSGLVAAPGDNRALEEALDLVLCDSILAERLGKGARSAFEALPDLAETRRLIVEAWGKAVALHNEHKQ